MKKSLHLSLLVLVVFLSGCVGQPEGPSAGTAGVVIQNFKTDLTETEPGMPVILSFTVKNIGGAKATSVSTELIGLTNEWSISPGRTQSISDLLPADPERGITEGQEDYKEWSLTGPAKNVKLTYNINARVYYTYATVSESLLRAVTYDYFRQTQERGGIEITKATGGPLSVTVKAPSTIISGGQVMVQFEIQNVGGGRAYKSGDKPTTNTLDMVSVSISGADCDGTSKEVRLVNGKTGRLYCRVNTAGVTNFQDFTISLTVNYKYYLESTTSISVLPAIEGITPGAPGVITVPTDGVWLFWNYQTKGSFSVDTTQYRVEYVSSDGEHIFNITNPTINEWCNVALTYPSSTEINVRREAGNWCSRPGAELKLKLIQDSVKDLSTVSEIECKSPCYRLSLTAENYTTARQDSINLAIMPKTASFTGGYKITLIECVKGAGGGWETVKLNVTSDSKAREVSFKQGDSKQVTYVVSDPIWIKIYQITGKGSGANWDAIPTAEGGLCRVNLKSQLREPLA